jgi:hypothetical protein
MRGSSRREHDDSDDLQDFIGELFDTVPKIFPSYTWLVDDNEESEEEKPQKNGKVKKFIESSDEGDSVVGLSDSDTEPFSMLAFTKAGMEQAAAKARAKGKGKALAKKAIKQAWNKSLPSKRRDNSTVQDTLQPRAQPKMLERFIPSAKMKWVMKQLKEWQNTHPSDKVNVV